MIHWQKQILNYNTAIDDTWKQNRYSLKTANFWKWGRGCAYSFLYRMIWIIWYPHMTNTQFFVSFHLVGGGMGGWITSDVIVVGTVHLYIQHLQSKNVMSNRQKAIFFCLILFCVCRNGRVGYLGWLRVLWFILLEAYNVFFSSVWTLLNPLRFNPKNDTVL